MTFKQKIIFIISLAFFQIFYLLSNYTGQYLNSFFLLTCLTAAILCYNLYQLLMQLFTSEKVETANYAQTECQFRYCGTAIPFLTVRSTAR